MVKNLLTSKLTLLGRPFTTLYAFSPCCGGKLQNIFFTFEYEQMIMTMTAIRQLYSAFYMNEK